jgi:hypothetical protein
MRQPDSLRTSTIWPSSDVAVILAANPHIPASSTTTAM